MNKKIASYSIALALLLGVSFVLGKVIDLREQALSNTQQGECKQLKFDNERYLADYINYCIRDGNIFYIDIYQNSQKIKISNRADAVKVYNETYGLISDGKNIYYYGEVVKGVSPKTFSVLSEGIFTPYFVAKDNRSVYVIRHEEETRYTKDWVEPEQLLIFKLDSVSFEVMRDGYFRNQDGVYKVDHSKDKRGLYVFRVVPLKVDKDSFEFFDKGKANVGFHNGIYFKDKNGVYFNEIKISEADLGSFKLFTEGIGDSDYYYTQYNYAKDNNNVYYRGNILKESDTKSFDTVVNNGFSHVYAKDNKNVYLKDKVIPLADPITFKTFPDSWKGGGYTYYSADKNYVFYELNVIEGADPKTFEQLDCFWGKDSKHVYIEGRLRDDLNPENFEPSCEMG